MCANTSTSPQHMAHVGAVLTSPASTAVGSTLYCTSGSSAASSRVASFSGSSRASIAAISAMRSVTTCIFFKCFLLAGAQRAYMIRSLNAARQSPQAQ